jgi:hypothetical protein
MDNRTWEESALDFYYTGFYRVLKRFRAFAVLGWGIALAGGICFFFGWDAARSRTWPDLLLCAGAIVAGVTVVQAGIAGLYGYVRVRWYWPDSLEGVPEHLRALKEVMNSVDRGGWREAAGALETLETIGHAAGLPPPGTRNPGL